MIIKEIVDLFYKLSKEHKLVMSFKYDNLSKGLGLGDELQSQVFLEDPIFINDMSVSNGNCNVAVKFYVLLTKQLMDNINVEYPTTQGFQSIAEGIALNIIARLRKMIKDGETEYINGIGNFSMYGLSYYSDNNQDGVSVTIDLSCKNPINFCDIDEHFDAEKEFKVDNYLPEFKTDNAQGCEIFSESKLPKFSL